MGSRSERRAQRREDLQTLRKGAAARAASRARRRRRRGHQGRAKVLRADYELPLLAHATLEPQNCTADVRADGVDLYVPTQVQQIAQAAAAKAAGVDAAKVECTPRSSAAASAPARSGFHPRGGRASKA
jgi:CO/xanthine dehydrogenase Mo-binding subunit